MPWSILSRIRHSARRPETSLQDTPPQLQHESSAAPLPINRKILQDPSSFLDAETPRQDAFPVRLTPSTRLPAADSSARAHARGVLPRTPSRFTVSRMSKSAAGGEWSTFGRKRDHQRAADSAGLSGRRSAVDAVERTSPTRDGNLVMNNNPSTFTLSRLTHPWPHDRQSSPSIPSPRQSPDISSPTNTTSSKPDPRTPQRPSSYTAPEAACAASLTNLTASVNRELTLDSPRTFGQPTPENSVDFSIAYPSPLPPLPPLDHPELVALRTRAMSTDQSSLSAFRDRSNTLPATHRPHDLFPSLSLRLEHSVRHRSSLPQAKHVFNTPTTDQRSPRDDPTGRRRARTISAGVRRRRTSADWSSYQATVGVNSHANQAWPAEVSREILRLSLGADNLSGSSSKSNVKSRGKGADPNRKPDTVLSPSFLPFPHPSRPPSSASATPTNARDVIPLRPYSLQSILENRKGSKQPGTFAMAKVKRSLSAIETRNGSRHLKDTSGAAYTSSGLSDATSSLSKAPQGSPLLHPFSTLAPSRSLPSGRASPAATMASSVQGEPSTPTPAPRQLSDKSRGKRKAEDNLDLTPPEQKKEGQRATFLLPTESRGQRISNASHAPSSYHRKRARLSSTSPFATPVQSRPPSVQETPQSGSRNHYYTSLSSTTGGRIAPSRTPSRAASAHSRQPPTPSTARKHERHQSMSQVSIPISAIVSPHAPSISRSTKFHMRDPRRPPKKPNDTPWKLEFTTEDEPGSSIQAWFFFFGFLLFPVWWIAGFLLRIPATRIAGDVDTEKGVPIDDPQIEHDARTWRFRCRVMAVVSLFTYIPFVVLVAIFAPR